MVFGNGRINVGRNRLVFIRVLVGFPSLANFEKFKHKKPHSHHAFSLALALKFNSVFHVKHVDSVRGKRLAGVLL